MGNSLNRTVFDDLSKWYYREHNRKPLIIRGARQIGKTTSVRLFAQKEGLKLIECNLEKKWDFTESLSSNNPKKIIEAIEFQLDVDIDPKRSLLFFDEAQAHPSIIANLRYFYEEMPEYAIIVTGSLLEFTLAEPNFSMPVGRIELCHMNPFSFEEFLAALDKTKALSFIENYQLFDEIPVSIHESLCQLVRLYCLVGGMPEVIATYKTELNLRDVERVKSGIIETFILDFNKYTPRANTQLLRAVFESLPNALGKKVIYSNLVQNGKSNDISIAVKQLQLAKLLMKVYNCSANGIPLAAERNERYFKMIHLDIGLLLTQLNLKPNDLEKVLDLNLVNRGDITEQFIGQQLRFASPSYQEPDLYYWARDRKGASAEVDYVSVSPNHQVLPIEVKSGKTGTMRSLQTMIQEKSIPLALRFNSDQPTLFNEERQTPKGEIQYHLLSLPHYLIQQKDRLCKSLPGFRNSSLSKRS
jgi:predicted AAA+ superfamily ATPase